MTQELIRTDGVSKADIINDVKRVSGEQTQNPRPMNINFDAKSGIFSREIDKVNEETGFNDWEEIGPSLSFQMMTMTKSYKPNFNSDEKIYSQEFRGGLITLFGNDKEIVWQGLGKELKNDPISKEITYVENAYVMAKFTGDDEATLYKLKLSGSNLINWYPYLKSFGKDDSSTFYLTTATPGKRMIGVGKGQPSREATAQEIATYDGNLKAGKENKMNLFYLINFTKGVEFPTDQAAKRLNDVNEYLSFKELNKQANDNTPVVSKNDTVEQQLKKIEEVKTSPTYNETVAAEEIVLNAPPF